MIMAAGLGSRFGGDKQLIPIGPGGETLIDYSVYDAIRAGISHLVFIVRPEIEDRLRCTIGRRWERRIDIRYVQQRIEDLPAGMSLPSMRTRPWGTGHAVLAAESAVSGSFWVINADDYYGPQSFRVLAEFCRAQGVAVTPCYAMVGFALRDTLPLSGRVSRAICRCAPDQELLKIEEIAQIERYGHGARYWNDNGAWQFLDGQERVSMNLWGFTPAIFGSLRAAFRDFLAAGNNMELGEFFLPAVVQRCIQLQQARVKVLSTPETWCGLTHPDDRARAADVISQRIARGDYPQEL